MKTLTGKGFRLVVQSGAGEAAQYFDGDYVKSGAKLIEGDAKELYSEVDVVLKVRPPLLDKEVDLIRPNSTLISFVYPAQNKASSILLNFYFFNTFSDSQYPYCFCRILLIGLLNKK